MKQVSSLTNDQYDRENVSSFIYRSGKYTTFGFIAKSNEFWPELRVTLDDHGDYMLIKNVINYFYSLNKPDLNVTDVVNYIKTNSNLLDLNKDARVTIAPFQKVAKTQNE